MHPYLEDIDGNDFSTRDAPSEAFIAEVRRRYPTERETDELFSRKLRHRSGPPYARPKLGELTNCLKSMLDVVLKGPYDVSDPHWFTGGVSKIQIGFTLAWTDPNKGHRKEHLVARLDPSEGSNTTSRVREFELINAFRNTIPVPEVFWLDRDGKYFPEPALIYAFAPGVTKPRTTTTGKVSGLGTVFGPKYRELIAPQFLQHLAAIHTFDYSKATLTSFDRPSEGTTESALWQLNRARRIWEEDRGEDFPLIEVAFNWLERHMPRLDKVSVVHGDFRSGNFLFDEETGKINAWLDWERAHLGDRHRDLAWMTQLSMGHYSEDGKTYYVCGLIAQDELFKRYEDASGLSVDPDRLAYYKILNCCQIIGSALATAYRVPRLGKSHQDILLSRVKGITPTTANELARLLRERL
jgi:aminoglycoside phosphotransferase (APT) family kinase protein